MGLQTRPTHVRPQTTAQARRAFTSHGPRISTQQSRQLARGAELYERSERIKDAERRRKQNARKKMEKEEREREARRRIGIPSPAKAVGKVAASQGLLVGFVRVLGRKQEEAVEREGGAMRGAMRRAMDVEIEAAEGADFGDDVLDDDSLLEAVEQKLTPATANAVSSPVTVKVPQTTCKRNITKESTSFTGSTDFVLARDITWTQDIEAARSFDSELIKSPTLTPEPQPPASKTPVFQDCWDDMVWSNTQIEREIAATPPRQNLSFMKPDVSNSKPVTLRPTFPTHALADPDESFLSMLSTQDLTFSSPELDRHSLSPTFKGVQCPAQAPDSRPSPERTSDAKLMPPPPRPSARIVPPEPKANVMMPPPPRTAAKGIAQHSCVSVAMRPPPRPVVKPIPRIQQTMPPPLPTRPVYRTNNMLPPPPRLSPARTLPRLPNPAPLTTTPLRPYISQDTPYKPFTAALSQQQDTHKHYNTAKSTGDTRIEPMTDWVPADFELSTQDCREIGVG